jgi:hypothetical protein
MNRMDGDTTQPTRIDEAEYERFKQFVQDTHGSIRGHLRTELENALREYRQPDDRAEPLTRIEDDIATIKAQLSEAESDGGTAVATPAPDADDAHTHTNEKPSPKAPRADKIAWLTENKLNGGSSSAADIKEIISREFGVEKRTAQKYVQPLIDELNAKRHPQNPNLLVWGDELARLRSTTEEGEA